MKKTNKMIILLALVILSMLMFVACTSNVTVEFDSNGGSEVERIVLESGNALNKPTDPTKTGYTFGGWMLDGENFDFTTKIEKGIKLKAKWIPNSDTPYSISYYQQNVSNDEYSLFEVETKIGTTDSKTEITPKNYRGFVVKDFENIDILGDGTTEICIYYDRNMYNITFNDMNGGEIEKKAYRFGATILEPEHSVVAGYTLSWNKDLDIVTQDTTYSEIKTANDDTTYTIETYLESTSGSYDKTRSSFVIAHGTTDTEAIVTDVPQITGFYYDESAENILNGTILGDGSLNLKIFYRRNVYDYKFYNLNGDLTDSFNDVKYGVEVNPSQIPVKEGVDHEYIFAGWIEEIDGDVISCYPRFSYPNQLFDFSSATIYDQVEDRIQTSYDVLTDIFSYGMNKEEETGGIVFRPLNIRPLEGIDYENLDTVIIKYRANHNLKDQIKMYLDWTELGQNHLVEAKIIADGRWNYVVINGVAYDNFVANLSNFENNSLCVGLMVATKPAANINVEISEIYLACLETANVPASFIDLFDADLYTQDAYRDSSYNSETGIYSLQAKGLFSAGVCWAPLAVDPVNDIDTYAKYNSFVINLKGKTGQKFYLGSRADNNVSTALCITLTSDDWQTYTVSGAQLLGFIEHLRKITPVYKTSKIEIGYDYLGTIEVGEMYFKGVGEVTISDASFVDISKLYTYANTDPYRLASYSSEDQAYNFKVVGNVHSYAGHSGVWAGQYVGPSLDSSLWSNFDTLEIKLKGTVGSVWYFGSRKMTNNFEIEVTSDSEYVSYTLTGESLTNFLNDFLNNAASTNEKIEIFGTSPNEISIQSIMLKKAN